MPIVMTVDWKHVLLDPLVFQSNGTYRVARVRGGWRVPNPLSVLLNLGRLNTGFGMSAVQRRGQT